MFHLTEYHHSVTAQFWKCSIFCSWSFFFVKHQVAPSAFISMDHWVSFIRSFIHSSVTTEVFSSFVLTVVPHGAHAQQARMLFWVGRTAHPPSNYPSLFKKCNAKMRPELKNWMYSTYPNECQCLHVRLNKKNQVCSCRGFPFFGLWPWQQQPEIQVRSFVCNQSLSNTVCKPPHHISNIGGSESLLVARQAQPHHSCQGNACMQRDGGVCWGLVVKPEDWWGGGARQVQGHRFPNMVLMVVMMVCVYVCVCECVCMWVCGEWMHVCGLRQSRGKGCEWESGLEEVVCPIQNRVDVSACEIWWRWGQRLCVIIENLLSR